MMVQSFNLASVRPSEVVLSRDGSKLYSAGKDGILRVYSLETGVLINSWQVGTKLGGLDLSPDGSFLMVVERQPIAGSPQNGQTTITVYKVDTATGQTTSYPYQATGLDYLFFDVAVLSNGKVLLSQDFAGSGWVALKLLDPATGQYTLGPQVSQSSVFTPTPDGSKVFIGEPNNSGGPVDIYQTGAGIVAHNGGPGFSWGIQGFTNSGTLAANYIYNEGILIYNSTLQLQTTLQISGTIDWRSGRVMDLAFDPSGQYLFVLDSVDDAIVQLRTSDWGIVTSIPVNADVGGWAGMIGASFGSRLIVDPLSRYFSVATDTGLVLVANPNAPAMEGTAGVDVLHGTLFNDAINGNDGGDLLFGGAGADTLAGGAGDDQYYVYAIDSATFEDSIVELPGGGFDQVRTTFASFSLAGLPEVESLFGIVNIAFTLTGNDGDNYIIGNNSADTLEGGLGNDKLEGQAGDDVMRGGPGDDEYVVNEIGDVVEENAGEGIDTIFTTLATYSLVGTQIENLFVASSGARDFRGNGADNLVSGASGNDLLRLQDGGADEAGGGAGDDIFYFGGAFDGADRVYGEPGRDVVILQGNYALTLSATNLNGVESLSLQSGSRTTWGDLADNFYDYAITTHDSNVAAGQQLIVNGQSLRSGEDFAFDGSAETNGFFLVYGGHGVDTLKGGAGNDAFFFEGARFGPSDTVDGGAGRDALIISAGNGITHIEFGATSLTSIESISLNARYATDPTARPSYELVLDNGNVTSGGNLIVNGNSLADRAQTVLVDGSAVHDGSLTLIGGFGNDTLIGGDGGDLLQGGEGIDMLTGGGGADVFRYAGQYDATSQLPDRIADFLSGTDRIDLGRIDADAFAAGDQAFHWIGSGAFSATGAASAGELRAYEYQGSWYVEGDMDGNGVADLVIQLTTPVAPVVQGDFQF